MKMRMGMAVAMLAVLASGCWEESTGGSQDVIQSETGGKDTFQDPRCPAELPPDQSACPAANLSCTWGPEACQCGTCHPAFGCDCSDGKWNCWHTDPIPEAWCEKDVPEPGDLAHQDLVDPNCPADPPIGLQAACTAGTNCTYGQECCCGNCYPSTVCSCINGQWGCYATDACRIPGCPDVPVTEDVGEWDVPPDADVPPPWDVPWDAPWDAPDVNPACPAEAPFDQEGWCQPGVECSYGQECCCGNCYPSLVCNCYDGRWGCYYTDACMIPSCPDVPEVSDVPDVPDVADVPDDTWYDAPDVNPECPADVPYGQGGGCQAGLACGYGQQYCCGAVYPATWCECNGWNWTCRPTDACMMPCWDVPPEGDVPDVPDVYDPDAYEVEDPDAPDLPPGCCLTDADCVGAAYCAPTALGGRCVLRPPAGECWTDADCTGARCIGPSLCPCGAWCDIADMPGRCEVLPSGCCQRDGDCPGGEVCRAEAWDLPGSCLPDPRGPACPGDEACCWDDRDCPTGSACQGALACGCIELCPMCGACAPDQMGVCR